MSSAKLLFAFVSISLICSLSLAQRADARGTYVPPVKEYREPGLWYGDSFVPEEVKQATYKNYRTPGLNAGDNNQYQPRQNPETTKLSQPQSFSGPAHIEPDQYHYFVQEYHWPDKDKDKDKDKAKATHQSQ